MSRGGSRCRRSFGLGRCRSSPFTCDTQTRCWFQPGSARLGSGRFGPARLGSGLSDGPGEEEGKSVPHFLTGHSGFLDPSQFLLTQGSQPEARDPRRVTGTGAPENSIWASLSFGDVMNKRFIVFYLFLFLNLQLYFLSSRFTLPRPQR